MGKAASRPAPHRPRRLDQGLLGRPPTRTTAGSRGSTSSRPRRGAAAPRPGLRGPLLLPPPRPGDAARRDGPRHGRPGPPGEGPLLGHERVAASRSARPHDRAPPERDAAADRAAAVQPAGPRRFEREYSPRYERPRPRHRDLVPARVADCSPGSTTTASPAGSRMSLPNYQWLRPHLESEEGPPEDRQGQQAADAPGAANWTATMAQLAIAWCLANDDVSTVITGASRPEQVAEKCGRPGGRGAAHARRCWSASRTSSATAPSRRSAGGRSA